VHKYDTPVNRESAYEILAQRAAESSAVKETAKPEQAEASESKGVVSDLLWGSKRRQGLVETMAKQAARTVGSQLGRKILRGLLGGLLGGKGR
jgi:hypothetical protein